MRQTYVASDNSTGDAQVLGPTGQDVYVRKVILGSPTNGGITRFYNSSVATGHTSGIGSVSDDNLALMVTQPTGAAGKDWQREINFGDEPLQLDGGSFHTDENQVTVIWEPIDEAV